MKISLLKKLSLAFLITVLGSILITNLISNYMVSKKFDTYLIAQRKNEIEKVKKSAIDLYDENYSDSSSCYDSNAKSQLKRYSKSENIFIEVKNIKDKVVFSSSESDSHKDGMMNSNMESMMHNHMINKYSSNYEYIEKDYPISKGNKKVGTITIGFFSNSYLNEGSLKFKSALNNSFLISAFIALVIGLIIGIIMSKGLTSPLLKITNAANKIRNGNLKARANLKTSTKEVYELRNSINYLAVTLEKQENIRKRMTSDIAHELRTPLTILKTHIEGLLDGIIKPTEENLESFYEEIERLINLVENLRNLSRLDESELNLNKSNFNISKETIKITNSFEALYHKKGFKILKNIDSNIIVFMDKDKFNQIVYNLFSNSYKYLPINGEVNISLKKECNKIILKIKDNGCGIPSKDLPYIFERFYRSDFSRNKKTGGSGIGLTITKKLVEAHNGTIKVESKINKGTIFTIEFPL